MKRSKIDSDDEITFSDENSSDSEGSNADGEETLATKKKKYIQKPREAWCHDPHLKEWIVVDKNEVQCRYCDRYLNVKFSSLKAHGYSQKHLRAERRYKERAKILENEKGILSKHLIPDLDYDETGDGTVISEFDKTDPKVLSNDQDDIQTINTNNDSSKKKRPKRRCTDASSEKTYDKDDLMAMRIAIEKDKVKAIGDMSKQISSAIRYLADSIRLTIQNNNFSKNDKT